jgi:type I restriction enzyme S subunit
MKLKDIVRESRETYKGDMSGIPVVGLEHLIPEEICFSEYEICSDKTFTKAFHKGQVLFGRRRAYQKKAAIAHVDGVCSGDIMVLEAIPGKVEPSLLPFIIQNDRFFDYAIQHSEGGLSPRVKWNAIANYEFDLPSIEEQKVLADKLWAAYRVKEAYRQLLSTTDEMLKAKFQEMFGKEPTMTLGQLAESWSKGQAFKKDEITETGKTPCIHYGQLYQYGAVIEDILSYTDAEAVRTSKIGDILFPASDVTPKGLARCSCINKDGVILGGDIIIMHPLEGLNSSYLSYAINQQTQQLLALVTGSVVRHMSAKSLQTVRIPVPEKVDQQQFAEIATQAEATKTSLRASMEAIDRVIRSLINQ